MSESIDELAKKFKDEIYSHGNRLYGKGKVSLGKKKDVNCGMCQRKMTVRDFEHQPYYCYRCEPELEAVLQ